MLSPLTVQIACCYTLVTTERTICHAPEAVSAIHAIYNTQRVTASTCTASHTVRVHLQKIFLTDYMFALLYGLPVNVSMDEESARALTND